MARFARIVLAGSRTDDELDPMTLDVILNEDLVVTQNFPTSGWWGRLKGSGDFEPFVFHPSGKLDFGTGFEETDRYLRTNVQAKKLDVGEYVTFEGQYEAHCFQVKQIIWLDEIAAA